MTDEHIPPREDDDPRERDLSRRSNAPAVSLWLVVVLIAMLAAGVYAVSAML